MDLDHSRKNPEEVWRLIWLLEEDAWSIAQLRRVKKLDEITQTNELTLTDYYQLEHRKLIMLSNRGSPLRKSRTYWFHWAHCGHFIL